MSLIKKSCSFIPKKKKNPILVASNFKDIKQVEKSATKHFPHVVQKKKKIIITTNSTFVSRFIQSHPPPLFMLNNYLT